MATTLNNGRVLGRLRLSRATDESTSIVRQKETIQQWADANGHTVVAWAEDIDVSGSIDPFDTPHLGPWLNERTGEWDILVAWKLDRLGRNAIQLNKLFGWCGEHDKTLVSCAESIDLGHWAGRMLAGVIAGLAEGELEAIRERTLGSRRKLREKARWPGGKPPFGYTAVKRGGDSGWMLSIDPLACSLVQLIVDQVIDGKPTTQIARELNAEGYLTPTQYYEALKSGSPTLQLPYDELTKDSQGIRKPKWASTSLRNLLRNKSILGHVHHGGETVRDDEGRPLQLADPLVTLDQWELVQSILDSKQESRRGIRRAVASPLSGVVVCYKCGYGLHHTRHTVRGRYSYRYYRCENRDMTMIPAEMLESLVEEQFLDQVGDLEVRERVWVPGDSREVELREAITALDDLSRALAGVASATSKQRIQDRISAVDARIVELESTPARESRWEYQPVGGTYRSVWESSDVDQRRELLLRSGITVAAGIDSGGERRSSGNAGAHYFEIRVPDGITERMHSAP